MTNKPNGKKPKKGLSDEMAERIRAQIINGTTGYGHPPTENQFKKGQSGNPKGRPRKAAPDLSLAEQPLLSAVHAVLKKPVKARDGDKVVEMSAHEALAQAALNFALKGNARYYGILVDSARQAEDTHAREIRRRTELWRAYQIAAYEQIAEAEANGEPEPEFLPHPDDIVFDPETGPDFVGPFDEISKAEMQETIAYREALLLQAGLDEKLMPASEKGDLAKGPGTALEFAKVMNRALPPRLRMTELHMHYLADYYSRHPVRWLLKTVHASWLKVGKRRKRGELFPPLGEGLTRLNLGITLVKGFLDGSLGEISEAQMEELVLKNRRFASQQGWIWE